MALTTEEQAELDDLIARRRTIAGIKGNSYGDQAATYDHESLDRRIAILERKAAGGSRSRYAATSKGTC